MLLTNAKCSRQFNLLKGFCVTPCFVSPFLYSKCVMDKFAIILDAAVDVLHEIDRVEDGGTHTE